MELLSKLRWVIVVIALLLLLVLAGWGLSTIARNLFRGNTSQDTSQINSIDVLSPDTLRYTQEGPIVANSDHRSYTIEVSRSVVIMRVYSDYGRKVIAEKSYQNSEVAYNNLLEALQSENVTARVSGTTEEDDTQEVGVCPEGRRYIVEVGDELRRWITDCEKAKKTAAGNMPAIRRLFSKQIPDFQQLIKGTGLR